MRILFYSHSMGYPVLIVFLLATVQFGSVISKEDKAKAKIETSPPRQVIVVGGGLAGMAAARHLQRDTSIKVKILEAMKDRYGGRIWTKRGQVRGLMGVDRELGGTLLNTKAFDGILNTVIKKYEIDTVSPGKIQIYFPTAEGGSKVLSGDEAQDLYVELFRVIMTAVKQVKASGRDRPLYDVISDALDNYTSQDEDKTFDKEMLKGLFSSFPTPLCRNFSTLLYDVNHEFGWESVYVQGMDAFIDRIVGGEGTELPLKVDLNKVVRNIKIDDNRQKVLVRTTDRKQLVADAVILAVPIGVLKSKSIIIEPPMTREWYQAVSDIGLGYSSKVVVGFQKAFWPKDPGAFTVSSDVARDGFLQMWTNAYKFSGNPYLIGNIFGEAAKEWEKKKPAELKKKVVDILGQMFGKENVAANNITVFIPSKWSTDEFILGSVSYPRVGNTEALWETLRKPACPYLYFAGAHTDSLGHVDSLHGAYRSGIRAADQILNKECPDYIPKTTKKKKEGKKDEKKQSKKTEGSQKDSKNDSNKKTMKKSTKKDEL